MRTEALRSRLSKAEARLLDRTHRSIDIALGLAAFDVLTLVGLATTFGNSKKDLGSSVLEIHLQWHQGRTGIARYLEQLEDLALVGEQSPGPGRFVLSRTCWWIFRNVHPMQSKRERRLFNLDPSLRKARLAIPYRLDLGSPEPNTTFKGVTNSIIVPGSPVFNH
jgi:hypothetical protein